MKNEIRISRQQLIEMLKNWNFGAQPVSVQYETEPDMNTSNKKLFPNLKKIANVGGFVGYVYENSVNNQLEREQKERDFIARPLWNGKGKRISTALSTHVEKNTYYLTFKHQQTFRSIFIDLKNLTVYSYNQIKDYLKPYSPPKNQGVEQGKEIQHREISIDNIRRLKFKKTTYEII